MNIALFTIIKNQNAHLRVWVEYYKKLGVSHIYIADNNELDGENVDSVIGDYKKEEFVTVFDRRNKLISPSRCIKDIYEYLRNHHSRDFLMVLGVNEYLKLQEPESLASLLSQAHTQKKDVVFIRTYKITPGNTTPEFMNEYIRHIYRIGNKVSGVLNYELYISGETYEYVKPVDACIIKYDNHVNTNAFDWPEIKHMDDGGISICITAYKAAQYIEEALDSVARQTWFKTHNDWEVLVGVDGCEETFEKMKSIAGKYKNLRVFMMDSNRGTYVTTNTIMKLAQYDNLLRFDADDIMHEDMVEKLMINRFKGDIFMFKMQNFGNDNQVRPAWGPIFIKKSIFEKFGGFRDWTCSGDSEFRERLKNIIRSYNINEILMDRRVHSESLTQKAGETCLCSENRGSLRQKYLDFVKKLDIRSEKDAVIDCVTNTYTELREDKIYVNFTTWSKRDWCVPIMLEHFQKQTMKPDKVFCWLSKTEYNGVIPESIQKCIDSGWIDNVFWVNGNTYPHKRWETFKYHNDAYNIMIDDDIYYPEDFVEKLYITSRKFKSVTCYWSRSTIFNNGERHFGKFSHTNKTNALLSGLSCFPPKTFPSESFKFENYRDKYCPKCDDSWVWAWLLKNGRYIYGINEWPKSNMNTVDNSQDDSIWKTHSCVSMGGTPRRIINMANCIKIANIEEISSVLWSQFDFNKYADPDLLKELNNK